MQESILGIFLKIWSNYPIVRKLSYFVMVEKTKLTNFFKNVLKNVEK